MIGSEFSELEKYRVFYSASLCCRSFSFGHFYRGMESSLESQTSLHELDSAGGKRKSYHTHIFLFEKYEGREGDEVCER